MNEHLVIDFDSTIVSLESLDELAKIALRDSKEKEKIVAQIERITTLGMQGKISFNESLQQRLELFTPTRRDIEALIDLLSQNISHSFITNSSFISENSSRLFLVSGGFREFIEPIVLKLGLRAENILANTFRFKGDKISSFDESNVLSKAMGKVKAVESLELEGKVIVLGDGYTDYEIKKMGIADTFLAYTEHKKREEVIKYADEEVKCFCEVIEYIN